MDLNSEMFSEEYEKIVYVGTSRARFKLEIICNINKQECEAILNNLDRKKVPNPEKTLATIYNSKYKKSLNEE